MARIFQVLTATIFSTMIGGVASAAPIDWTPPPFMDDDPPGTDLGALDVGTNSISSSLLAHCSAAVVSISSNCGFFAPVSSDENVRDVFQFSIGPDLEVLSAVFSVSNWMYVDNAVSNGQTGRVEFTPLNSQFDREVFADSGSASIIDGLLGSVTGPVSLSVNMALFGNGELSADWSLEIVARRLESVPTVPLPATWSLMLVGLAGLGLVKHAKTKRKSIERPGVKSV